MALRLGLTAAWQPEVVAVSRPVMAVASRAGNGQQHKNCPPCSALQAHEQHAVKAVTQAQAAFSAEQQQRALAQQRELAAARLQDIAAQVLVQQQEAQQLGARVAELEEMQRRAAPAVLASVEISQGHRRPHQAAEAEAAAGSPAPRRVKSVRAAVAAQCQAAINLALPSAAVEQLTEMRAMPSQQAAGLCTDAADREEQQLAIVVPAVAPAWSDCWSLSSLQASPRPASPPMPRTVEELAAHMHRTCLLRHALRTLRSLAAARRQQAALTEQHFSRRTLGLCLAAWREQAAAASAWVAEVQPALRRRGLLRQWGAWVRRQQLLRGCEEELRAAYHRC